MPIEVKPTPLGPPGPPGPQGPPGPPGQGGGAGSDAYYAYTQGVPASVWTITHPLNKYPSITVVDSGENAVLGEISYIDSARVQVSFTAPFTGVAYLN